MRLHVAAPLLGHGVIVGPAPWFKLVRSSLRMGPVESQVGQLENHQWKIHGRFFTAFHLERLPPSTSRPRPAWAGSRTGRSRT